ncbi:hypothetical protein HDU93_009950 [Gonapodya sp. JEL0774]|nr:hypothetical protein HDU93_009950 [Gonapodya sp. JEL0774]
MDDGDPFKRRWVDLDVTKIVPFAGRDLYNDDFRTFGSGKWGGPVGDWAAQTEAAEPTSNIEPAATIYKSDQLINVESQGGQHFHHPVPRTIQENSAHITQGTYLMPPLRKTKRRTKKKPTKSQISGWYEPPQFKRGSIFYGEDTPSEDVVAVTSSDRSESTSFCEPSDTDLDDEGGDSDDSPMSDSSFHTVETRALAGPRIDSGKPVPPLPNDTSVTSRNALFYQQHSGSVLPAPALSISDIRHLAEESRKQRIFSRVRPLDIEPPTPTAESPSVISLPKLSKNDLFFSVSVTPPVLPNSVQAELGAWGADDVGSASAGEGEFSGRGGAGWGRWPVNDAPGMDPSSEVSLPPIPLDPPLHDPTATYPTSNSQTRPIPPLSISSDLRLFYVPLRKNLLGEGRYAQVFRGHYALPGASGSTTNLSSRKASQSELTSPSSSVGSLATFTAGSAAPSTIPQHALKHPDPALLQCAVKRYRPESESHRLAQVEAAILGELKGEPYVLKLVGVASEAPGTTEDVTGVTDSESGQAVSSTLLGSKSAAEETLPNTVPLGHRPLLVLELLPLGTLFTYVRHRRDAVGRRLWLKWARQLARAVQSCHAKGVVHHDVKPQNVLVSVIVQILCWSMRTCAMSKF